MRNDSIKNNKVVNFIVLIILGIPLFYLLKINGTWIYCLYQQNETIKASKRIVERRDSMMKEFSINVTSFRKIPKCKNLIDSLISIPKT